MSNNISNNNENSDNVENMDLNENIDVSLDNLEDINLDAINLDDIDIDIDIDDIEENDEMIEIENSNDNIDDLNEEIDLSLEDNFSSEEILENNVDNLNIKEDLGLEDELSLSDDEISLDLNEDFSIDMVDDVGESISKSGNEEFYGVDIKSGPETIIFFDKIMYDEESNLPDKDELEEKFEDDNDIVNFTFPEKTSLSIDEEQEKYLTSEMDDNLNLLDKELEQDIDILAKEKLDQQKLDHTSAEQSLITDNDIKKLTNESEEIELNEEDIDKRYNRFLN